MLRSTWLSNCVGRLKSNNPSFVKNDLYYVWVNFFQAKMAMPLCLKCSLFHRPILAKDNLKSSIPMTVLAGIFI